jgi:hypothetical protein
VKTPFQETAPLKRSQQVWCPRFIDGETQDQGGKGVSLCTHVPMEEGKQAVCGCKGLCSNPGSATESVPLSFRLATEKPAYAYVIQVPYRIKGTK